MELTTRYLGFELSNPFVSGAGPMSDTVDSAKQVEDAGASAIVMRSLFAEQFEPKLEENSLANETASALSQHAQTTFPEPEPFAISLDQYLERLRKIKAAVHVPVIASLNGHSLGAWLDYARLVEQAGADAVELNLFYVADNCEESAAAIEQRAIDMVKWIKDAVTIPLAVKLSSFYTSIAHFARNLEEAGADGIVLFNRVFETDIDVETMKICPNRQLSDSRELLLRLRWLAILSGSLSSASLAVSGGVHSAVDAVKAIMCGASAIQMVSSVLKHGPEHIANTIEYLKEWMQEKEYESLEQMRATMSTFRTRANYMRLMQTSQWA